MCFSFNNDQITIATKECIGEESYTYIINKSGNSIFLTFKYDSGF